MTVGRLSVCYCERLSPMYRVFAVLRCRGRAVQGGSIQVLPEPVARARDSASEAEEGSEVRQFSPGQSTAVG
jgi:hypothetical protein